MSRRFAYRTTMVVTLTLVAVTLSCNSERSVSSPTDARMMQATRAAPPRAGSAAAAIGSMPMPSDSAGVAFSPNSSGFRESSESNMPSPMTQQPAPGSMLVRVGQASLEVDSLEVGIGRVREMARRTGAVIANTSMEGGREQVRTASLELRIPSERFDEAVNGLRPIGKLESVSVSVQDVGEEYVDVEARMVNARRLEQRLIELLANRTGKLADVLSVEHELARVREQIERYEGRLRYLRSRASISTLTLSVHEPFPIVAERPGTHPIRDAFVQAWRNLIGVTAAIISSLGVIVPLGLIVVVVALVGRRIIPARVFHPSASKSDA